MEDLQDANKIFKILSIDGGGIRGIIPAKVLSELESELSLIGKNQPLHQQFDLICGTSTGALLAVGIALGIPASKLLQFYHDNAKNIFPRTYLKVLPRGVRYPFLPLYSNKVLKRKLREIYSSANGGNEPLLNDLKTNVCIPVFNGSTGAINILKTKHHPSYIRDYKIPAYEAALSSASAPVYFAPHSFSFTNEHGIGTNIGMIDGGIFANNPVLVGLLEAHDKLGVGFDQIKIISLGTGQGNHIIKKRWKAPSVRYWMFPKPRLLDIILNSQAQITEQYLLFLKRGLEHNGQGFEYMRIQYDFGSDFIDMSTSSKNNLARLDAIGGELAKNHLYELVTKFF